MKNIWVIYKELITHLNKNTWMSNISHRAFSLKLITLRNVLLFGLALFLSFLNVNGDNRAILCIVKERLDTPFSSFFEEKNSTCVGCLFPNQYNKINLSLKGIQKYKSVEVIETSSDSIELVINADHLCMAKSSDDIPWVFVLSSRNGYPTNFTVSQIKNVAEACTIIFVACENVEVIMEYMQHEVIKRSEWKSQNVISKATDEFGVVTSYTNSDSSVKVFWNADQNYTKSSEQKCSRHTRDFSPVATCSVLSKQVISGCYYRNRIGQSNDDVHIIDINHKTGDDKHLFILVNGIDTEMDLRRIEASELHDNKNPLKRNLTLVLYSKQPISLTLHVKNLEGLITLLIGGNDDVENISPPDDNVTVSVRKIELPKTFHRLLMYVLSTVGLPISYIRSTSTSVIKMLITSTAVIENTDSLVQSSVVVECLNDHVLVSIPRTIAERGGVVAMSLSDPSCFSKVNDSHLFVTSKFNACGFYLQSNGDRSVYSNVVYVDIGKYSLFESDDEDFEEGSGMGSDFPSRSSQIRTVVHCKLQEQYTSSNDFSDEINYKMTIYKDEKYSVEYQDKDFPVNVPDNSFVNVKLSLITDKSLTVSSNLRLMVEECWLSSSHYILKPQTLIRKSCAIQPFVRMHIPYVSQVLHFQFKLSAIAHPKEAQFLHCEVGLCSMNVLPKPSIVKCVHPRSFCGKENLLTAFANQFIVSKRKTLVIGPLKVINYTIRSSVQREHSEFSHTGGYGQFDYKNNFFNNKQQQPSIIVVEGLSTEAVVGIAILSFALGIGLMGTLWYIYTKTDPGQQRRPQSNASMAHNYEIDVNSGSSTPSSEVPMTA